MNDQPSDHVEACVSDVVLIERVAKVIRDCVRRNDFSDHELYCMSEEGYEYVAKDIASAVLREIETK